MNKQQLIKAMKVSTDFFMNEKYTNPKSIDVLGSLSFTLNHALTHMQISMATVIRESLCYKKFSEVPNPKKHSEATVQMFASVLCIAQITGMKADDLLAGKNKVYNGPLGILDEMEKISIVKDSIDHTATWDNEMLNDGIIGMFWMLTNIYTITIEPYLFTQKFFTVFPPKE